MKAFFPDASANDQAAKVSRLLQSTEVGIKRKTPECLHAVLQILSTEDDFSKLADLKVQADDDRRTNLIIKREGYHRGKAAAFTPKLIKDLKPPGAGIYINMQTAISQFAGYYERPPPTEKDKDKKRAKTAGKVGRFHTTARLWGGKWTQLQALTLVVNSLWGWHKKYGKAAWLQ